MAVVEDGDARGVPRVEEVVQEEDPEVEETVRRAEQLKQEGNEHFRKAEYAQSLVSALAKPTCLSGYGGKARGSVSRSSPRAEADP